MIYILFQAMVLHRHSRLKERLILLSQIQLWA